MSPAVSTYDVTQTFDSNDNLTSRLMPVEAALSTPAPTTFGYDAFNNRIWSIDPRGDVTVDQFDAVNRGVAELTTRGPVGTYPTPAACRTSAPADSPIAAGMIVCTTTTGYDGVDNVTSRSDGNGQTTTIAYDGVHRETSRLVPRDTTVSPAVLERTDTLDDQDGHVTDVCPPREFTEGAGACSATAAYSEHRRYDLSGRVTADTTYRTAGGAASTATSTIYVPEAASTKSISSSSGPMVVSSPSRSSSRRP